MIKDGKHVVGISREIMDFRTARQLMSQWCWAASIRTVLRYYDVHLSQRDIVARTYGTVNGKLPNWSASYTTVHKALNDWGIDENGNHYVVKAKFIDGVPKVKLVINELYNGRPLIVGHKNKNGGGHAVVLTGVEFTKRGNRYSITKCIVRDPYPSPENKRNRGRFEYSGTDFKDIVVGAWMVRVDILD